MPDYDGNIWFVTRYDQVGFVDKSDKVHITNLDSKEEIHNTIAISADGVFLNSNYAQYRFDVNDNGEPYPAWRTEYDRGSKQKPGSILQGSGTTPTLLDVPRSDGSIAHIVGISDNADDRVNVVIFDRDTGSAFLTKNPTSYPSVARVELNADVTDSKVVWISKEASPTTVPKLSTKSGLVYLYTREINKDIPKKAVAWYLTAIDYETGETKFKVFTGTGRRWNNSYAPITIGPNKTVYVGVFNGVVAVKDSE